jgi:hypothetical protein
MSHIHWVARQNKLEIPNDEEEVNTREIHKCDGQAHDPDTMVAPLTPKPTRKAEALAKAPPTITSRREEDVALKKWPNLVRALSADLDGFLRGLALWLNEGIETGR